jgi:hypothetical protein
MPEEPSRPDNRELIYHYSRDHRLARASEAVRALNDETPPPRPNLFRTLTATKPLALLFITIIIMVVFISLVTILTASDRGIALGGNTLTVSALRFQGTTYLKIKKTCKEDDRAYTGAVDVAVSVVWSGTETGEIPLVANERIFFSLNPEEEFPFSVPFEAPELRLLVQSETEQRTFKVRAK